MGSSKSRIKSKYPFLWKKKPALDISNIINFCKKNLHFGLKTLIKKYTNKNFAYMSGVSMAEGAIKIPPLPILAELKAPHYYVLAHPVLGSY